MFTNEYGTVTIEDLINKVRTYIDNEKDIELIKKAYDYASCKHFGQKRITGDDYIIHPLNVALILTDNNADTYTICAGLLHDVLEDSDATYEEMEKLFGKEITSLVDGVTKINKINFNSISEQMAANQRKILVGLSNDVRVIIIKLADRLHNMRTLYVLPEEKQKRKAKETLEILTPVAHRLGIYKLKSELEDLSLRYLKPDAYYDVVEKLNLKKTERDVSVSKMMQEVSTLLNEHKINHEIKGRSKSIYSIYQKLNKGKKFNDIYDLLALRVLVNTEQECYLALGLIHSKYKPVPKRFKDYIAMPKTNLYQSLHTTIFGIDGELFEIQIRTYEMNKIAEYGIASHWSYKEHTDGKIKDAMEQKLQIFRSIIELNNEATSSEEFINDVRHDVLTNDSIFVYTPKGDVIELPENSTPVDFAYKVHSEVGNKMVGAIVNDNIVPLDYKLKTGDIIKINTNNSAKGPNKDWLNFVVTAQARNRIKSFYSKLEKVDLIEKGSETLEKEIRKNGYRINDILSNQNVDIILKELGLVDMDEVYYGIASNKYTANSIIKIIKKDEEEKEENIIKTNNQKIIIKNDVIVEDIPSIKVSLSNCCKPIPGDNIIGYITKGHGVTVHRSNCKNISSSEERLISVKWNNIEGKKYPADIIIYTKNNDSLVDVVTKAQTSNIQISSVSTINNSDNKIYFITVLVSSLELLNKYMNDLLSINYIDRVERLVN